MKSGFTIIELLVSIAVFLILTSIIVVNYLGNNDLRYLRSDAQMLVDDIQNIQNMALTGESVDDILPDYYNIYFKTCTTNCTYNVFASTTDAIYPIVSNKQLKYSTIDTGIIGSGEIMVAFRLPRGRMIIYTRNGIIDEAAINISSAEKKNNFCLELNSISGRIGLMPGVCVK